MNGLRAWALYVAWRTRGDEERLYPNRKRNHVEDVDSVRSNRTRRTRRDAELEWWLERGVVWSPREMRKLRRALFWQRVRDLRHLLCCDTMCDGRGTWRRLHPPE